MATDHLAGTGPPAAIDHDGAEDVGLPRSQTGSPPQHLLTTLLGDYWYGRREHLPSAALVRLVGEFGVTAAGARAALSRLARRGLLDTSKLGRRTFYGLTREAARLLADGGQRIMTFGTVTEPWDEGWTVAAFSVPEDQRDIRHVLRTRLRWLGFAPLYDGMWVSPRARPADALALLGELGIEAATVLRARTVDGTRPTRHPISAWDLAALGATYERFIADYTPLVQRIHHGDVSASEALVARTEVMDTYRNFPNLDPELPTAMLPANWPRDDAQRIFVGVYDALGPLAEIRVRQIVSVFAPELAPHVRHHTTRSVVGGRTHRDAR